MAILYNRLKRYIAHNHIFYPYIALFLISFVCTSIVLLDIVRPHKLTDNFFEGLKNNSQVVFVNIESIDNTGEVHELANSFADENLSNANSASSYYTLRLRNNSVDDNIRLRGWAFIPGENTTAPLVSYVLYDEATQEYYKLHTELEERPDVTEVFGQSGNYNYDLSGIVGNVPSFFLKRKHVYTVGIIYQHNDQYFLYMSDKQINTKGEMN